MNTAKAINHRPERTCPAAVCFGSMESRVRIIEILKIENNELLFESIEYLERVSGKALCVIFSLGRH